MSANFEPENKDPWANIDDHIREKTMPSRRGALYLHVADLNEFIKAHRSEAPITILDYGAGASPYRKYFPNADYRRADIEGVGGLNYIIGSDSTIAETDNTFDLILSTQVAEHVPSPSVYFKECHRLLKKGGILILTTHGISVEHGVPYDFQRWTQCGLRRDLMEGGFKRIDIYKLTCGLRAAVVIFTQTLFAASAPTDLIRKILFKGFRWTYSQWLPISNWICDRWWPEHRIYKTNEETHSPAEYIVIAAIAEK
jgi:SAM-dependent methyltransferase